MTQQIFQRAVLPSQTLQSCNYDLQFLPSMVKANAGFITGSIVTEDRRAARECADRIYELITKARKELSHINGGPRPNLVFVKFEANLPPRSVADWQQLETAIKQAIDTKLSELNPGRRPWIEPLPPAAPTEAEAASVAALMALTPAPQTTEEPAPASVTIPEVSQEAVDLSLLRIQLAGALARTFTAEGNLETLRETHAAATAEIAELRQQTGGADQPLRDLLSDIMHSHANGETVPEHIVQRVHEIDQAIYDGEISQGVEHARNLTIIVDAPQYNGTNG